jgi:hypothetical protein
VRAISASENAEERSQMKVCVDMRIERVSSRGCDGVKKWCQEQCGELEGVRI